MKFVIAILAILLSGQATAHQWTPTYPVLKPSYVEGIYSTRLKLFNGRRDVSYYEIQVLDENMNGVMFATNERVIRVDYLKTAEVDVYIREQDIDTAVYICSKSKLLAGNGTATVVSSRICSKLK